MTRLLLVRHAHAGDRGAWVGDDALRPLSARGVAQAAALPALLGPLVVGGMTTVASSPAERCTATVTPLAAALGTDVAVARDLAEGGDPGRLLAGIAAVTRPTVWCSHGDVIPALLVRLAEAGLDLGPDPRCRKASTWVLDVAAGTVTSARYLAPPADDAD